jgi:ATP-dependent Lon protease
MIPLVEGNVNLIELGPRGTGKTFLLRNLSPHVFTVSGGRTSPASLFLHKVTGKVGILGQRKVVVFDEVAATTFPERETVATLKDYMESGQYSRGTRVVASDASLVLSGNLDVAGDEPQPTYTHLFEELPAALIDPAFLDRLHGYLPGWEIPKLSGVGLAQGVGFVTDYFGEMLVKLRDEDFHCLVRRVVLAKDMTRRDQVAVERLAAGLLKLLFPMATSARKRAVKLSPWPASCASGCTINCVKSLPVSFALGSSASKACPSMRRLTCGRATPSNSPPRTRSTSPPSSAPRRVWS